ncbi:hypothetical protein OGATHE_001234 [Ogataea polymorpha]|uniref:Uncharacterized protein n=1 Tax=Ogataea polymorpha TaxID=460523 RepID=A0A9P8TFC9_9ASCO|nr:hypothetical protein OGATHE_001234 [Ogataea polymorpha]
MSAKNGMSRSVVWFSNGLFSAVLFFTTVCSKNFESASASSMAAPESCFIFWPALTSCSTSCWPRSPDSLDCESPVHRLSRIRGYGLNVLWFHLVSESVGLAARSASFKFSALIASGWLALQRARSIKLSIRSNKAE